MTAWRRIASNWIVRDRWMKLRADTCELGNGQIIDPYYVIEESDWVHVFAQDDDGKVLIVKQYRYAAEVDCAELPGGVVDAGEAPLTAAKRELEEETGYLATDWRKIGQVYANPARQTNSIHIFLAHGLSAQSEQRLDATEEIVAELASIADIKAMIKQGTFSQSLHIASFYMSLEVINQAAPAPDDFNRL